MFTVVTNFPVITVAATIIITTIAIIKSFIEFIDFIEYFIILNYFMCFVVIDFNFLAIIANFNLSIILNFNLSMTLMLNFVNIIYFGRFIPDFIDLHCSLTINLTIAIATNYCVIIN